MEGDKRVKAKRIGAIGSLLLCTFLSLNPAFQQLAQFPDYKEVSQLRMPSLPGIWSRLIMLEELPESNPAMSAPLNGQTIQIAYKLFGIFPLKTSEVEVMPDLKLFPGGQSIGVSLQAKGVMIVGQAPVVSKDGKATFPAKDAGIEVGDIILKVENTVVQSDQDVASAIDQAGQKTGSARILVKHQGQIIERSINTIFCQETGRHRVGLFVRNEAAGVGTLTYVDPETKKYGALGHVINDADTNQRIEVLNGNVVASTIYAIEKGKRGNPGEKVGSFVSNSRFNGNIEKNCNSGIFGTMQGLVANPYFKEPVPVGWESEIKEGPAKIYTVIQGEKVEEFEVKIERIMHNRTDSKNMVIRVTDPKLIDLTGGIIQGMSGSPIVQDGKIVGAITHVFVNDSTRGYGVFIQNMLKESGLFEQIKLKNKAA
ncbi:MAG: SpoIVB peptidase [Desulfitobacterium hafniense]|nr:SpoIVB peptidase [Desulfitobacterium hafniense]